MAKQNKTNPYNTTCCMAKKEKKTIHNKLHNYLYDKKNTYCMAKYTPTVLSTIIFHNYPHGKTKQTKQNTLPKLLVIWPKKIK